MTSTSYALVNKIQYQIVFNHNGHLRQDGTGSIDIQLTQGTSRVYIQTKVRVKPEEWDVRTRSVISSTNPKWANTLNLSINAIKKDIETVESTFIYKGIRKTIKQLKDVYKSKFIPTSSLSEYIDSYLSYAKISDTTKRNYITFKNNISKFNSSVKIEEIDYDFIIKYQKWLKTQSITDGTITSRLTIFKTILSDAVKRHIIQENPLDNIKFEQPQHKTEYLKEDEVQAIENYSPLKTDIKKQNFTDKRYIFVCDLYRIALFRYNYTGTVAC